MIENFFNHCGFSGVWKDGVDWEICGNSRHIGYDGLYGLRLPREI